MYGSLESIEVTPPVCLLLTRPVSSLGVNCLTTFQAVNSNQECVAGRSLQVRNAGKVLKCIDKEGSLPSTPKSDILI
jgi:hypothetical protein